MAEKYDFIIIIGGGAAGCVLARRLVDTDQVSVLLLEAEPNDWHPYIHMPARFTKLTGATHNWGYETVPQKGLDGSEIWYPQGRVLGGGTSINAQIYTRRQSLGLRQLGRSRLQRLVLQRGAALFPQG